MSPGNFTDLRERAQRRRAGLRERAQLVAERTPGVAVPKKPRSSAGEVGDLRRFFNRGRFAATDPGVIDKSPAAIKGKWKELYESINSHINSTIFESDAVFLNYGYVDDGGPRRSRIELPPHYPNRNCVELILELVGDEKLTARDVLDVGCGRGGNIQTMKRFFHPNCIVGLDMSFNAVNFCRRTAGDGRTFFLEGDAERLPFAESSFDAVTNVESSCCYPDWPSFLREVHRVLRPGGSFLHTDLFPNDTMAKMLDFLLGLGFALERDQDISKNVLLSCDEAAKRVAQVYKDFLDEAVQTHFVGVPGTTPYDEMVEGTMSYRIFRFRKS